MNCDQKEFPTRFCLLSKTFISQEMKTMKRMMAVALSMALVGKSLPLMAPPAVRLSARPIVRHILRYIVRHILDGGKGRA